MMLPVVGTRSVTVAALNADAETLTVAQEDLEAGPSTQTTLVVSISNSLAAS